MKKIYLFSYINSFTMPKFKEFLQLSKNKDTTNLVILVQNKENMQTVSYFISESGVEFQKDEINYFYPDYEKSKLSQELFVNLEKATGILVWGGNMHVYQYYYGTDQVANLIKAKYEQSIPYAGISAGAILTTKLKLINNVAIKPHFAEQNRFFELIKKMNKSKRNLGFGIDDNICAEISNDNNIKFFGKDTFYIIKRKDQTKYSMYLYKNQNSTELDISEK